MRKRIFKTIYLCFVAFLLALLVSAFFMRKATKINVTAYTKPYNIVSKVGIEDSVDIELLLDETNTFYSDKEQIESSYIVGDEGIIKIKIKEIYIENSKIEINEKKFHVFHYLFEIDFNTSDNYELFIKNAYLELGFLNGIKSTINIGSFTYYKYNTSDDDIMFSMLKVINTFENETNLYGIQVGIRNISTYNINIKRIVFLDVNAKTGEEVKLEEINESKNVIDYFSDYSKIKEKNDFNIEIKANENVYYAIALSYMDEYKLMYPLEKLAIMIEYEFNSKRKTFVFENFLFYEQNFIDFSKFSFEIFTYDNR